MDSSDLVDQPSKIRKGEELNLERLRQHLEPVIGKDLGSLQISQFPGGHSNLTYFLKTDSEQWVLRRPPFGSKVKSAHDMSREFKILDALKGTYPFGPEPIHFCDDHEILGCDFYLMNYIKGLVIRREYPEHLRMSPEQIRNQLINFFDALGDLHSLSLKEVGLDNFGKPHGYVKRQVEGWSNRWVNAVTPDTVNCDEIIKWLQDNMPEESGKASVIHNDYKLDNLIFDVENTL